MANKITLRKRHDNPTTLVICCNGEPISGGKVGNESTARFDRNPATGFYELWIYLYISEEQHVCADILADPNDPKPALKAARAFVRHTLETINAAAPL